MSQSLKSLAKKVERAFFPCTQIVEQAIQDHKRQCIETINSAKSAEYAICRLKTSLDKQ